MRRFEYRLLLHLLPVVAVTLTIVLAVMFLATKNRLVEDSRAALEVSERNFAGWLQSRSSKLVGAATAESRSFAFRRAVASGDRLTILAALEDVRDRAGATRLLFIGLDGRVEVETAARRSREDALWADLRSMAAEGPATAFAVLNDHAHQVALVPVLAPDLLGWIGISQELTNADLVGFLNRTTLPINLSLARLQPDGGWQLVGTTLGPEAQPDARTLLAGAQARDKAHLAQPVGLGRRTFIAVVDELPVTESQRPMVSLLQYSVDEALLPYEPLFLFLLAVGVLALLGVVAGLLLMARSVTRPIRALDEAAQRIRAGEYGQPVALSGDDELARLGATFDDMMEAIATREQHIIHQSLHDAATDLPNLENFRRQLDARIAAGESFAVLLFELVGLDEVTNTLGHELAEQVVASAIARVAASCKRGDVIARLAGRTFGMCLPGATATNAESVAHRVMGCLADPIALGEIKIDVFAQAGIAACPEHARNAVMLLRHAEVALAETSAMDHCAIYDPSKDPYDPALLSRVSELRAGLGRGEFELYYQPKVDLRSENVVGAEALVRWNHPQHGLLLPGEFVPLAERTGVIQELTRWAIAAAIAHAAAWCRAGHDLGVAVNLSAKDLRDPGLPAFVGAQLRRAALPSGRLTLEITESAFMERPDDARLVLASLRDLGVSLAVDDFGTGYSSLAYLRRLPVSELKLDRSFVGELSQNAGDRTIARTIIDLGRDLGLSVTAEGVEDANCIAALREMGCPVAQGYYFSPPVAATQFEQLLRTTPWRAGSKVKVFPAHGLPSVG